METLDQIMDRGTEAPSEERSAPKITDADRAANPIGSAKAERDHQGRFSPKTEREGSDPKPEGEDAGDKPASDQQGQRQPGQVPQQALEAERRKRQERDDRIEELLRQNAELMARGVQPQHTPQQQQQPAEPVFWEDPNAATDYRVKSALDPVQQRVQDTTVFYSQRFAVQEHGAEAVQQAVQSLAQLRQSNPQEYQRLEALASRSMDPVGDVVRWNKQQRAQQEVGLDPEAYFQRRLAEYQAKQQGGEQQQNDHQQQPAQQQVTPRLPSSFAGQRSGAPRSEGGYGGPRALSDIMPRG